jgi:hypothetical protein
MVGPSVINGEFGLASVVEYRESPSGLSIPVYIPVGSSERVSSWNWNTKKSRWVFHPVPWDYSEGARGLLEKQSLTFQPLVEAHVVMTGSADVIRLMVYELYHKYVVQVGEAMYVTFVEFKESTGREKKWYEERTQMVYDLMDPHFVSPGLTTARWDRHILTTSMAEWWAAKYMDEIPRLMAFRQELESYVEGVMDEHNVEYHNSIIRQPY